MKSRKLFWEGKIYNFSSCQPLFFCSNSNNLFNNSIFFPFLKRKFPPSLLEPPLVAGLIQISVSLYK